MKKILLPFLALAMVMFMDSCQTSKHGKYQVPNLRWHSGILSYEITSVSARRPSFCMKNVKARFHYNRWRMLSWKS